jgi:two-component system cell cycle sensor histidine kinase PleC
MFGSAAEYKKIDIETFGLEQPVHISADETRIRQVLLNLISNAVKFTPAGGHVHISLYADFQRGVIFSVSDSGIGIAATDIERVQRPFEQIENACSTQRSSTGLGLLITESIVKLHGGTLTIKSRENIGTTVTIKLPASRLRPVRQPEGIKKAV